MAHTIVPVATFKNVFFVLIGFLPRYARQLPGTLAIDETKTTVTDKVKNKSSWVLLKINSTEF